MEHLSIAKRNITPEKAKQILEKHGTKVTVEEAKIILDFLYKFGRLTLKQAFKQ